MEIPDRLRKIWESVFPPPTPRPDPLALYKAQQVEAQELARQERIHYAKRMGPFAGRLLLVTDFGLNFPLIQEEHAARVAAIIRSTVFDPRTPLGISINLTFERAEDGQQKQINSAELLDSSLRGHGFENIAPIRNYRDSRDLWLSTIAIAAENTAKYHQADPSQVGHIAVVDAVDARSVNVSPLYYTGGEIFMLTDASDAAEFTWRAIPSATLDDN